MSKDTTFISARKFPSPQLLLVIFATAIPLGVVVRAMLTDIPLDEIGQNLLSKERNFAHWFQMILGMVGVFVGLPLYSYINKRSRLCVGEDGIRYDSGLPRWLIPLTGRSHSWSLTWEEISDATIRTLSQNKTNWLTLRSVENKDYRLSPVGWKRHASEQIRPIAFFNKLTAAQQNEVIQTNPLLCTLTEHGVTPTGGMQPVSNTPGADLSKNKVAVGMLGIMLVLALYASMELMLLEESYVGEPPWELIVGAGLAVAFVACIFLIPARGQLNYIEVVGLSLVLGLVGGAAAHPGLLRASMLADADGLRPVKYELASGGVLHPQEPEYPTLVRPVDTSFWVDQEVGSTWTIHLRRGPLEFWQYDSESLMRKVRLWYRKNRRR